MRKAAIILLTVIIFTAICFSAVAESSITVRGTGETQVSADTATVTLGVSARDRDVLTAQQTVNAKIAGIREALIALGIAEECINTNYINIYALYDYTEESEQISAYNASSSLGIRITDIEKVGAVIDAAFKSGANTLDGISFSATDTEAVRAESLKKAVADATAKADVLAAASGLRITGTVSVYEEGDCSYSNSVGNFVAEDKAYGSDTLVQAAKIIVSETVSVTFTAE